MGGKARVGGTGEAERSRRREGRGLSGPRGQRVVSASVSPSRPQRRKGMGLVPPVGVLRAGHLTRAIALCL